MKIITLSRISKTYNPGTVPVHALRDLELSFVPGEFTAVVGPSGSGKSTLLNIIGGLDSPTTGEVVIDDTRLHELSSTEMIDFRLHHIGFVFQNYSLLPVLTARENVEFIMQLQQRDKKEYRERAEELLVQAGLKDEMDRRPGKLSGGQQQRVAVARALASRPRFILADEPTANLDSRSTGGLLDIMLEMNRKEHMTFIFSTHDQRVIDRARRVITIEDGQVHSDLTAKEHAAEMARGK